MADQDAQVPQDPVGVAGKPAGLRRGVVTGLYLAALLAGALWLYVSAPTALCTWPAACNFAILEFEVYLFFAWFLLSWVLIRRGADGRLPGTLGRHDPPPRPMTWEDRRAYSLGALSTIFAAILVKELVEIIGTFLMAGPVFLIAGSERVWLRVAVLAVLLYMLFAICGVALCRLALRVLPPRAARGYRYAGLALVTLGTGTYLYQTFFVDLAEQVSLAVGVPVEDMDPIQLLMFDILPLAILAVLAGAYIGFAERHLRPAAFLERPFVLFLRRFSTVGDRTVVRAALRSRPPGHRIALLTPGHSRLRDWDARLVSLTGLSLVNPLGSIPVFLGERDAEWRETVERCIARARVIIFEASDDSDAMRFEADTITRLGRWRDTIVLHETAPGGSGSASLESLRAIRTSGIVTPMLSVDAATSAGPDAPGSRDGVTREDNAARAAPRPLWPTGEAGSPKPHAVIRYSSGWSWVTVVGCTLMWLLASMIAVGYFLRLFVPSMTNATGLLPLSGVPVALVTTLVFAIVAAANFFHPVMDRAARRRLKAAVREVSTHTAPSAGGAGVVWPALALMAASGLWVALVPEGAVIALSCVGFAALCIIADRRGQARWMRPLGFMLLAALAVVGTPPPVGPETARDVIWWTGWAAMGVSTGWLVLRLSALVQGSAERAAEGNQAAT